MDDLVAKQSPANDGHQAPIEPDNAEMEASERGDTTTAAQTPSVPQRYDTEISPTSDDVVDDDAASRDQNSHSSGQAVGSPQ